MAIVAAWRPDSIDLRYSRGGKTGVSLGAGFSLSADAGAIGGQVLLAPSNNTAKTVEWNGRKNTPNGRNISVMCRIKTGYTGTPAASRPVMPILTAGNGRFGRIEVFHAITTGNLTVHVTNEAGTNAINTVSAGAWSPASQFYDIAYSWDGTTAANSFKLYIDGALFAQLTPTAAFTASWNEDYFDSIALSGSITSLNMNAAAINEWVIWDEIIDFTSNVTLTSGSGLLNGNSRTAFVNVSSLDGQSWTTLSADKIKTGEVQTQAGASVTGTYTGSDRWTDPGESNVRSGTAYKAHSTSNNKTGTLDLPLEEDVESGVIYDNGTKTGTLSGGGLTLAQLIALRQID
jgi:hypothetical protein